MFLEGSLDNVCWWGLKAELLLFYCWCCFLWQSLKVFNELNHRCFSVTLWSITCVYRGWELSCWVFTSWFFKFWLLTRFSCESYIPSQHKQTLYSNTYTLDVFSVTWTLSVRWAESWEHCVWRLGFKPCRCFEGWVYFFKPPSMRTCRVQLIFVAAQMNQPSGGAVLMDAKAEQA